jgi:uncharacterized protein involved in response to NO
LHLLLDAPHRLAFFAGALMLAGTALWWLAVLMIRAAGVALPWAVPPPAAHALLMAHGFMPLFFLGFACTGAPRWMGLAPMPARQLLVPVGGILAGWALVFAGVHTAKAAAAAGLALVALCVAAALWRLAAWVRASRSRDRLHVRLLLLGQATGVAALLAAAVFVAADQESAVPLIVRAGLWAGHGVVFMAAAHRLVPYFAAGAWPALQHRWPAAMPIILTSLMAVQAPGVWLAAPGAAGGSPMATLVRGGCALAAAVIVAALAGHWAWVHNVRIRLVAMLYAGVLWLAIALALQALGDLGAGTPWAAGAGLASLHAMALGFMGSIMLAMVTRVACAQHGRAVVADGYAWGLFGLAQVAVVARVLGAWVAPAYPAVGASGVHLAALFWAMAATGWALRYGRWFITARASARSQP